MVLIRLIINLFSRSVKPKVDQYHRDNGPFLVELTDKGYDCDCLLSRYHGVPCSHETAVCLKVEAEIDKFKFSPRWTKLWLKAEDLPPQDEALPRILDDVDEEKYLNDFAELSKILCPLNP